MPTSNNLCGTTGVAKTRDQILTALMQPIGSGLRAHIPPVEAAMTAYIGSNFRGFPVSKSQLVEHNELYTNCRFHSCEFESLEWASTSPGGSKTFHDHIWQSFGKESGETMALINAIYDAKLANTDKKDLYARFNKSIYSEVTAKILMRVQLDPLSKPTFTEQLYRKNKREDSGNNF